MRGWVRCRDSRLEQLQIISPTLPPRAPHRAGRVFSGLVSYALGALAYIRHEHVKPWCCGRFGGHDTLQLCFNDYPAELQPSEYTSACFNCMRTSGKVGRSFHGRGHASVPVF